MRPKPNGACHASPRPDPCKNSRSRIQMFFGITGAFVKEGTREQRIIIGRYCGRRWCDSTERALNSELMGR